MTNTEPFDFAGLPIDPEIDDDGVAFRRPASRSQVSWFPRLAPDVVATVFVGGIFGGLARYGIGQAAAPSANGFPWDIFAINLGGAFVLALLLVLVIEVFPGNRYLRPGLGTGFLGAFTTFSSLTTGTDHLLAHGGPGMAISYAVGSLLGGLIAAILGLACGRLIGAHRIRARGSENVPGESA